MFHGLIGVLPQNPQSLFVGNTVREDLWEMFSGFHIQRKKEYEKQMERVIEDTQIGHLLDMHPYDLSGGEQQMLAMGRAMMSKPRILLLDEPSMGLSPLFVGEIFKIIEKVSSAGTTVLLVEQNAKKALSIADRAYVLETGRIRKSGNARELLNDDAIKKAYLGE